MTHYILNERSEDMMTIVEGVSPGDILEIQAAMSLNVGLNELTSLCLKAMSEGWVLICPQYQINTADAQTQERVLWLQAVLSIEKQRQAARSKIGIDRAQRNGKSIGRPKKMTPVARKEAVRMVIDKGWSISDVAAAFKVHPSTISRLVKKMTT